MRAGALRHRVTLQRAAEVVNDTTGGVSREWIDLGLWSCEERPASVREGLIDGGVRDETEKRFVGRYNSAVGSLKAADRAVSRDGLTFYNLVGPALVSNDRREATLRVRAGLNDGR